LDPKIPNFLLVDPYHMEISMSQAIAPSISDTELMHSVQVLLYQTGSNQALTKDLSTCCQHLHLELHHAGILSNTSTADAFSFKKPTLVLLPVVEKDCLSIKWAQHIRNQAQPVSIGLVARNLPRKAFLSLAFREGIDDILTLADGPEMLAVHMRRLLSRLQQRMGTQRDQCTRQTSTFDLQEECEALHRINARCKERLVSLATFATHLASGERHMAVDPPVLMILAKSQQQAATAEQLAAKLGFQVTLEHDGQSALTSITTTAPHIVLTDSLLPDMELTDFTHRARACSTRNTLTIVAWSSNPEAEDTLMRPEVGLDDFVLKTGGGEGAALLAAALLGGLR
jgi:DNA-binding response OmpR family regulator